MIVIRNFRPSDLSRVYEIECVSFKDPYHVLFLLNLYDLYPESFFVAEKNGMVVGYVISRQVGSDGHIIAIAVDPAHRRKGIGNALMGRVIEYFQSIWARELWLEVRVSNEAAIKFYKNLGFTEGEILHSYYADREDGIILKKRLYPTF